MIIGLVFETKHAWVWSVFTQLQSRHKLYLIPILHLDLCSVLQLSMSKGEVGSSQVRLASKELISL